METVAKSTKIVIVPKSRRSGSLIMSGQGETQQLGGQHNNYNVKVTRIGHVRLVEVFAQNYGKITPKTAIFGQKLAPFEVKFHSENMPKMRGFSMEKSYVFPSKIHQKITRKSHGFRHSQRLKTTSETSSKVLENTFETTSKPLSKLFGKPFPNPLPVLSGGSGNPFQTDWKPL